MSEDSEQVVEEPTPRRRRRTWPWIVLLSVVIVPAALFALWATITLHWSYSTGDRTGYVLKLSEKGWLCKTWEGELSMQPMPGMVAEKFVFSVRDDSVARAIQAAQAQEVRLHYEEHKGVPSACFGDTRYFVTGVEAVRGGALPPSTSAGPPPPSPATPPAPPR